MGTRHLILVYYKGEYRIAQYGQWDGYPSGQGVVVLAFVRDPENLAKLKSALDTPGRLFEPTEDQLNDWFSQQSQQQQEWYTAMDTTRTHLDRPEPLYPTVSRETGAKILGLVAESTEPLPIVKEVNFIADTVFCEWTYVVDLDAERLEVYAGLRDGDGQSRFGETEGVRPGSKEPSLMAEWRFRELPDEADFLDFLAIGKEEDDEE